MKPVIALIRVSTAAQAGEDRASIPAQRAVNRRTAAAHGLEIVHSIEMADVSGAAVLYAPEMRDLLERIKSPEIHGVVAREFSRLMRPENFGDYALLQAFAETKTVLYLPDGPMDFSTTQGRLMGTIRAAMAGHERSEIRERAMAAKEQLRRQGRPGSGPHTWPVGVAWSKQKGWHYTQEAAQVRQLFDRFLGGDTNWLALSKRFGRSKFWCAHALRNPIYAGWFVSDRKAAPASYRPDGRRGHKRLIPRQPQEVVRLRVIDKPLVSEEEFERAREMLDAKRHRVLRLRGRRATLNYQGFLTCGRCRAPLYSSNGTPAAGHTRARKSYYICRNRMLNRSCDLPFLDGVAVDAALDELFTDRLTEASFIRGMIAGMDQRKGDEAEAERIEARLEKLAEKRTRIADMFAEAIISQSQRNAMLEKCAAEEAAKREALAAARPRPAMTAEQLAELFSPFYEFRYLQRDEKRHIIATLLTEIRMGDHVIEGIQFHPGVPVESPTMAADISAPHWRRCPAPRSAPPRR